jgi:AcrR family transcriptional regulator
MSPLELPTTQPQPLKLADASACERADAARNRRLILAAAERLIDERGVEAVSMEAIADAAGVGKGTIFRRFGDRGGLMHSLIDERERELQDAMIRGEPPLGPGAPAVARIVAFGRAALDHIDLNGDIVLAAETGGRWVRFNAPVYVFYRTHLLTLAREAAPDADAGYLADVLLAPLAADFHLYQRRVRGRTLEELQDAYEELVRRMFNEEAA